MKSWIIILAGLWSTWHFMAIESDSDFFSVFLPILFSLFVLALVIKLSGVSGNSGGGYCGGGFGGGDSGGDSGGCGGGD
ncbi:hypothetical protein [Agarivorans sp. 1_MG-2023]|uniref:hypothetical protein n=1 Tax=Agarivorans sp. 1_MG-2023 TaxID=3062634 RepID=UPI0026E261A8|nr:hypothetical protein [Agarivorans sp. 1_MG-2023]MDO6761915.1 hypothetical protein [Agarivorans sp. 1_MG-2023]